MEQNVRKRCALAGSVFVVLSLNACATKTVPISEAPDGLTVLQRSDDRLNDDAYFADEFSTIHKRRGILSNKVENSTSRPENLVGLALSGGGIRSAAFQFGILAGMAETSSSDDPPILQTIDYISAVSGGSWTAGAYWLWPEVDHNQMFVCQDIWAKTGKSSIDCQTASNLLRTSQRFATLPIGGQRKEQWRDAIRETYLGDDSKRFLGLEPPTNRAYPIINATHSVPLGRQSGRVGHLPFQFTLHSLGTSAEILSAGESSHEFVEDKGFFLDHDAEPYDWRRRKFQRYFAFWDPAAAFESESNTVEYAMAASSGVARGPILLEYNFEAVIKDEIKVDELRELYRLSDGGKSDNSGIVSLIERKVDTIIASHMGRESDNAGNPFEDLILARGQSKYFFGCTIDELDPAVDEREWVTIISYQCPSGFTGKIVNLKPDPSLIDEFEQYLKEVVRHEAPQTRELLEYIEKERQDASLGSDERFPRTPTFQLEYDEELIRLYFLLGKFNVLVASDQIRQELAR